MELHGHEDRGLPERKGQKRKLEEEIQEDRETSLPTGEACRALLAEVTAQVNVLDSTFSWRESDRAATKRATHVLAELAKNGKILKSKIPDLIIIYSYCHSLCFDFTFFLNFTIKGNIFLCLFFWKRKLLM